MHVFTSASNSSTQRLLVSWILYSYFMIISSSPSLFLSHSNSEYLLRTLEWNKGNAGWFVCEKKFWLYQSNKLVDRPLNNNIRSCIWTRSKRQDNNLVIYFVSNVWWITSHGEFGGILKQVQTLNIHWGEWCCSCCIYCFVLQSQPKSGKVQGLST